MKKPPVTAAQWTRAREAGEGAPMTRARIAGMLGVHISSVHARASAEGWKMLDFRRQDVVGCYRQAAELSAMYASAAPGSLNGLAEGEDDEGGAEARGVARTERDVAGRDGVRGTDPSRPEGAADPVEMLARMSGFVARQLERLIAAADRRGGKLDKSQIDGLTALSRMAERWEAIARERAMKEQQKSDDELAETHGQVVDRLIQLAEAEAERLVDEFLAAQPDRGAGWRVAGESQA